MTKIESDNILFALLFNRIGRWVLQNVSCQFVTHISWRFLTTCFAVFKDRAILGDTNVCFRVFAVIAKHEFADKPVQEIL